MKIHLDIQHKTPLSKHHFDTWLFYFNATIDELFEGSVALMAKQRALSIATVMQVKIAQQKNQTFGA
jgi:hemoglobin